MKLLKILFALALVNIGCVDQNKNTYGEFSAELDGVTYKNYGVFADQNIGENGFTYALRTENLEEKEFGLVIELNAKNQDQVDFSTEAMASSSISIYDQRDDGYYTMTSGNAQIIEKTANSILVDFEASFINTKDSSKVINLKNGVFKINNLNPANIEE